LITRTRNLTGRKGKRIHRESSFLTQSIKRREEEGNKDGKFPLPGPKKEKRGTPHPRKNEEEKKERSPTSFQDMKKGKNISIPILLQGSKFEKKPNHPTQS